MILYENKGFETRSDMPNQDWTGTAAYVVDDNSALAKKVIENYPYYDFVVENGILVDVAPTEKPPEPTPLPSTDERLALVEETVADMLGGAI